jgi:hypothetical protein
VQSVRERLADRTVRGELNARRGDGANAVRLEPASHEVIVVFYGVSGRRDGGMDLGSSSERGVLGWRDSGCCVDGAEGHRDDDYESDDDDHTIDGDGDEGRTAVHRVSTPRSDFKATPSTTLHHIILVLPVAILALLSFATPCTCPPLLRTTPQAEPRTNLCRYRVTARKCDKRHLPATPILP